MEPRQVTAAQVRQRAGEEFDAGIPAVAAAGVTRESWIRARMAALDLDPDMSAGSWFGPAMEGQQKLSDAQQTAVFAAEFDASANVYAEMGIGRDQYIQSRRRDVGLATLSMGQPASQPEAGSPAPAMAADPANAKYAAEFDANPGVYAEMGLTKDQYIKSRRIDDGLDVLSMTGAAK